MSKVFSADYEMPEYIVEHIKNILILHLLIGDEDEYYDCLHTAIDDWIVGSTGEAKELVDDYGVLNAIRLYQENYGQDFEVDDDDDKVYATLSYCIIKDYFNTNYSYEELKKE